MLILALLLISLAWSQQPDYWLPTVEGSANSFRTFSNMSSAIPVGSLTTEWMYFRLSDGESLHYVNPLADFTRISFALSTEFRVLNPMRILIEDADGAIFVYNVALMTINRDFWVPVSIAPSDFVLAAESPIGKSSLDPFLIRHGLRFSDPNLDGQFSIVRVFNVSVEYAPFEEVLSEIVVDSQNVRVLEGHSVAVAGQISISQGACLIVKNVSRFYVNSGVVVSDPSSCFILQDALYVAPSTFYYQWAIDLNHHAVVNISRSTLALYQPHKIHAMNGTRLAVTDVDISSGLFTMSLAQEMPLVNFAASEVFLDGVSGFGEIMMQMGSVVDVRRSDGILLWPWLQGDLGVLSFPSSVVNYDSPPALPYTIRLRDCSSIIWAFVAYHASVTIDQSIITSLGMFFDHSGVELVGIRNRESFDDELFASGELNLRLLGGTYVNAFNFYTYTDTPSSEELPTLTLTRCLFGEAISQGLSLIVVRNSTCDGTGGYVGVTNEARLVIWFSQLDSNVIAHDSGTIYLYGCTITGDITADGGTIYINGSAVFGGVSVVPPGRIIYGDLVLPSEEPTGPGDPDSPNMLATILGSVLGSFFLLIGLIAVVGIAAMILCRTNRMKMKDAELNDG